MTIRNLVNLGIRNFFGLFKLRLIRLSPTKIRGIDPLVDVAFLLGNKRDPLCVDVGANDGETAANFLKQFPGAKLIAFEPFEQCCQILRSKFATNSNVRVETLALGASTGRTYLNLYSADRMNSLLQLDPMPENIMKSKFSHKGTADICVDTLDHFCRANTIYYIDVMKVDTQGYDLNVLKGASSLLKEQRVHVILLEINFIPMYRHQPSFTDLHEFLVSNGYRFVDFYNQVHHRGYTAWCDACYVASQPAFSRC
jgi:FkbM family methyltransferase